MTISEDTPSNYIKQLIQQVLSKDTFEHTSQNKMSVISFNKKRKQIDKMRVDINGNKLTPNEFKTQAKNYFLANYKDYSKYNKIVDDAIDDYLLIEENKFKYFNY
jgi:hypothetical protein